MIGGRASFPSPRRQVSPLCIVVCGIWVAFCFIIVVIKHSDDFGADLAPIYQAAALYENSGVSLLYNVDAPSVAMLNTALSNPRSITPEEARTRPIRETDSRPFRQPPLLAAILVPAVSKLSFFTFNRAVLAINLSAYAFSILLGSLMWRPALLSPHRLLAVLAIITTTTAFGSAISLNQIQMIVVALVMFAIFLDRKSRYWLAGICAALAITIKITPAVLLLAWLSSWRYLTAAWTIVALTVVAAASILICGWAPNYAFLMRTFSLSSSVIAAANNQSLRSFTYGLLCHCAYLWNTYPLVPAVRGAELAAGVALAGGLLFLSRQPRGERRERGILVYLLAATLILPPIVWDHYSLIMPMLLMALPIPWLDDSRTSDRRDRDLWMSCVLMAVVLVISVLEIMPVVNWLIWKQLYAAILLEGAVLLSALMVTQPTGPARLSPDS